MQLVVVAQAVGRRLRRASTAARRRASARPGRRAARPRAAARARARPRRGRPTTRRATTATGPPWTSAGNGALRRRRDQHGERRQRVRRVRPSARASPGTPRAPDPTGTRASRRARVGPTRWAWNSKRVTTPKSPPPPRSAQNRSGWSSARHDLAVGEHDLGADQRVDRQPVVAHQPADAAAERQPAHAGVRDLPAGHRQAVLLRRGVELAQQRAAADPHDAAPGSTSTPVQRAQVDAQRAVAHRAPGHRVAAAADRERQRRAGSRRPRRRRRVANATADG